MIQKQGNEYRISILVMQLTLSEIKKLLHHLLLLLLNMHNSYGLFFYVFFFLYRQTLSSLMVQVGVGSTACGLNIGVIVPHGDLTLVLLQDYPSTTAQYFSPVCLPSSIVNFTSSVDPDNCLVVSLGKIRDFIINI